MATVQENFIERSWFMSNTNPKTRRNKMATVRWRVPEVVVNNYLAAADDAARAATAAGLLIAAADALSLGVGVKVTVGSAFVNNTAVPPDASDFVFPFDKFGISFRADGKNYVSSIPARNDARHRNRFLPLLTSMPAVIYTVRKVELNQEHRAGLSTQCENVTGRSSRSAVQG